MIANQILRLIVKGKGLIVKHQAFPLKFFELSRLMEAHGNLTEKPFFR